MEMTYNIRVSLLPLNLCRIWLCTVCYPVLCFV